MQLSHLLIFLLSQFLKTGNGEDPKLGIRQSQVTLFTLIDKVGKNVLNVLGNKSKLFYPVGLIALTVKAHSRNKCLS